MWSLIPLSAAINGDRKIIVQKRGQELKSTQLVPVNEVDESLRRREEERERERKRERENMCVCGCFNHYLVGTVSLFSHPEETTATSPDRFRIRHATMEDKTNERIVRHVSSPTSARVSLYTIWHCIVSSPWLFLSLSIPLYFDFISAWKGLIL